MLYNEFMWKHEEETLEEEQEEEEEEEEEEQEFSNFKDRFLRLAVKKRFKLNLNKRFKQ